MTLVACWFERSSDHNWPWIASDSRILRSELPADVLLDEAAKIHSFPVIVREKWGFGKIIHCANIGVAFAGSTLVAQSVIFYLSSICGNLVQIDSADREISLDDIAELARKQLERYIQILNRNLGQRHGGRAELALTGWCPLREEWRIFHLYCPSRTSLEVKIDEFLQDDESNVLLLGCRKDEIRKLIADHRAGLDPGTLPWWRAPKTVLNQILASETYDDIGGFLQLGLAIEPTKNFCLSAVAKPIEFGKPKAELAFIGLEVRDEIGPVGPCYVGISGMVG